MLKQNIEKMIKDYNMEYPDAEALRKLDSLCDEYMTKYHEANTLVFKLRSENNIFAQEIADNQKKAEEISTLRDELITKGLFYDKELAKEKLEFQTAFQDKLFAVLEKSVESKNTTVKVD